MKDEVRKVVRVQVERKLSDGGIEFFGRYSCPWCRAVLFEGYPNRNVRFCPYCGKPVKWT